MRSSGAAFEKRGRIRVLLGRHAGKPRIMMIVPSFTRKLLPDPLPHRSRGRLGSLSLAVAALALTAAGSSRADIYKTVGADGVISFSNSPSKGGKLYARSEAPKPAVRMPADSSPG